MKRLVTIILLTSFIPLFSHEFYHEKEVYQGAPVTFVISPVNESFIYKFSLHNSSGKKVLEVKGFNYYLIDEKLSVILGLGGIPSNMKPGKYTVKAEGYGVFESYYFERKIEIKSSSYPKTVIKTNNKMDNILNGKITRERKDQAQRLWDALSRFFPYALYHQANLKLPVQGARNSSPFGHKRIMKSPKGSESVTIHKGEDYAIHKGTPIYSGASGRVLLAEERIVSGNTVIIEHLPGVVTVYYHMDSISVKKDEIVSVGDKIGEVGSTGFSTGPHLHWEIRFSTVPVDPKIFITKPLIDKSLIMNMINSTNTKKGG